MSLKAYLSLMIFATILCVAGLVTVLAIVNPLTTNWLGAVLFYVSLFLTSLGLGAILGFIIRFLILRKELAHRSVIVAFRQAFLFGLLITAVLWLKSMGLFSWLNVLLLIIGFSIIEFFLLSLTANHN